MDYQTSYSLVINQVVYACRENNRPVSEALVAYIINILYDKDGKNFYFKDSLNISGEKAKEVYDSTMELLGRDEDGELETIKLQVTYELAFVNEEEKIQKIRNFFDKEINTLINQITAFKTTSRKETESIQIHKKIFSYLLIKTRQNTFNSLKDFDSQTSTNLGISSEREIYAILDNVLPKSGLPPFISFSDEDKIAQLNDLYNIVMGIRLFNGEIGKGGIGLSTLNDLQKNLGEDLFLEVKEYHSKISQTCDKYALIYENIDFSEVIDKKEERVLENVRKIIVFYRQLLTYLSMLMDDTRTSFDTVSMLSNDYEKEVKYLIEVLEKKSAISKKQAYPRFENLAKMYTKFQEQIFIQDIRTNVFNQLRNFMNACSLTDDFRESIFEDCFQLYVENVDIYAMKEDPTFAFESGLTQNGVTVLLPHATNEFMDIKLDYQGFCMVTLMKNNGLLVNGKPNIVAKFKEKYMVFYNHPALQEFIDDNEKYVEGVFEYVKENPYLINLLNMTEEFPMANLSNLFRDKELHTYKYKSSSVLVDKEIQTMVHPHEKGHIDPNYFWNEWDLKRQALHLADIMNKKTVSSQTILSHFRRENETQVWPPKEKAVNTNVSKGTNLSMPKLYVSGLRKYDNKY